MVPSRGKPRNQAYLNAAGFPTGSRAENSLVTAPACDGFQLLFDLHATLHPS
jgi:hypothetical protein